MRKQLLILGIVFILLVSFCSALIPDDTLKAFYRFEEGSGTIANDSSIYNKNGTIFGAIYNISKGTNGTGNYSLQFDGTDRVECGDVGNFERNQSFSVSGWYSSTKATSQIIFSKENPATPYSGYRLRLNNGVFLILIYGNNPAHYIQINTNSIAGSLDGNWHHIVFTYDGSSDASGIEIYYDGIKKSLSITSNTLTSSMLTNIDFKIGVIGTSEYFLGKIDEMAIFNKTLNQNEVTDIFNNGINITEENNPPVIQEDMITKYLNLHYDNCTEIQWNVTDDDTLFYDINTTFINISNSSGLISGCYDNTSIGNYSIKVNATDTIGQSVSDTFCFFIYYDDDFIPDTSINYSYHTIQDINLYNATIIIYFNELVDVSLNVDGLNFESIDKYTHTIYMKPLISDTIYNLNFTATDNCNNTITKYDTFKTYSFDELEYLQRERNYTFLITISILSLFIILYVLGEIYFPAISVIAGIGFMIYAFIITIFDLWWIKFLLIIIGLFMFVRGVAKFFLEEK